jgi:hypothetical protein
MRRKENGRKRVPHQQHFTRKCCKTLFQTMTLSNKFLEQLDSSTENHYWRSVFQRQ